MNIWSVNLIIEGKLVPVASRSNTKRSISLFGIEYINNGELEENMTHRIKTWLKWRNASGILGDRRISAKLNENSIGQL